MPTTPAKCPRCGSTNTRVTAPATPAMEVRVGGLSLNLDAVGDCWRCDGCDRNWLAKVGSAEPLLPGGGEAYFHVG